MSPSPENSVIQWLNNQRTSELFLTTITIAEVIYGLDVMPEGKRKVFLAERFNAFVQKSFTGRILPFDESSAHLYGKIMSHRKAIGKPMSTFDGQIAAIAKSTSFTIATRNVKDFVECKINIINPFTFADKSH